MALKTRTAIISDIHGNMPALEAVLDDIERQCVDEIIVAGDMVGRGPQGSEVVDELRRVTSCFIGGNHEEYLTNFRNPEARQPWMERPEWGIVRWMADQLTQESADFIAALPFSTTSDVVPSMRIVHASPRSNREGIGPWTSTQTLRKLLALVDEEILVCAHTHRPMQVEIEGRRIVNIGAVGMPFNDDRRAQYAIFTYNHDDHSTSITLRGVSYDVNATLAIYHSTGFIDAGGVSARLLALELKEARPLLVPYQRWLQENDLTESDETLSKFLKMKS